MTDAVSARPLPDGARHSAAVVTNDLNLHYGRVHMLKHISLSLPIHRVTAFIGPSGCGKSTLLRCFNRMNDLIDDCRVEGLVQLHGEDVYDKSVDVADLRRRVGMVFQQPNPFPKSIFDNVAYGLRLQGMRKRDQLYSRVEWALRGAALWEETRHRLNRNAMELSGGQQQRLIIARAIAVQPDVLLLDEPASALDPLSTLRIEELVNELKQDYTIVIVTHNMQQAARIADYTAFLDAGEMVEYGETDSVFTNPVEKRTEDYITGRDS